MFFVRGCFVGRNVDAGLVSFPRKAGFLSARIRQGHRLRSRKMSAVFSESDASGDESDKVEPGPYLIGKLLV